jgi:hypothetical protein
MIEAVIVISVFVLFFSGMVYFESLYHQRMHVQQLARAAAVAYAMNACPDGNDPLGLLRPDLDGATGGSGTPSSAAAPTATVPLSQGSKPIGSGGDPLGNAMSSKGFALDKITDTSLNRPLTVGTRTYNWQAKPTSHSFMSCGDKQEKGDAGGVWDYIKNSFSTFKL